MRFLKPCSIYSSKKEGDSIQVYARLYAVQIIDYAAPLFCSKGFTTGGRNFVWVEINFEIIYSGA